jgi:hypothetical protein
MADLGKDKDTAGTSQTKRGRGAARRARLQSNLGSVTGLVLGFLILLMVNYLAMRHYYRIDITGQPLYSLSEKTRNILASLKEPLRITTFFTPLPNQRSRVQSEVDRLIEEYKEAAGDMITLDHIDLVLDQDRAAEMTKKYNFGRDENLVIFEYKDGYRILRDTALAEFEPMGFGAHQKNPRMLAFKGEPMFTGAILSLIEGKPFKAYFLQGHGERNIADASREDGIGKLVTVLKRENIEAVPLNLSTFPEVPEDADALVIVGPRESYNPLEVEAISHYLNRQGKVLLFQDVETTSGLESMIQRYNLKLNNDIVVVIARVGSNRQLTGQVTGTQMADHPAVRSLQGFTLIFPQARSLTLLPGPDGKPDPRVVPLVRTPSEYWGETNLADLKTVTFDPNADLRGPLTIAAVYDGGTLPGTGGVTVTNTRLLAVGSSLFLTNLQLSGPGKDFFVNTLNWMLQKDAAIGISAKEPLQYPLNVSPMQMRTISVLAIFLVSGVSLFAGLLVWYSRRK